MDFASLLVNAAVDAITTLQEQNTTFPFPEDPSIISNGTDWAGGEILNNGSVVSPVDGAVIDEGSYILVSLDFALLMTEHYTGSTYRSCRFRPQCARA